MTVAEELVEAAGAAAASPSSSRRVLGAPGSVDASDSRFEALGGGGPMAVVIAFAFQRQREIIGGGKWLWKRAGGGLSFICGDGKPRPADGTVKLKMCSDNMSSEVSRDSD